MRYRSEDLEAYARELNPSKGSLMLLNKADLLPAPLRSGEACPERRTCLVWLPTGSLSGWWPPRALACLDFSSLYRLVTPP